MDISATDGRHSAVETATRSSTEDGSDIARDRSTRREASARLSSSSTCSVVDPVAASVRLVDFSGESRSSEFHLALHASSVRAAAAAAT